MVKRSLRIFLIVAGLALIAYSLIFLEISTPPMKLGRLEPSKAEALNLDKGRLELARLRLMTECIGLIRNYYISRSLIHPKQMLVKSLKAVENYVPEVMVKVNGEPPKEVVVQVGTHKRTFVISGITDMYDMNWKLLDIFGFIAKYISNDVDPKEVEYVAINGMLDTLDEHTVFLPPEAYNEMKLDTRGEFGGLGIVITSYKGYITVMSVMPGTPAAKAGLKSKDRIVQIEDETTLNMPLIDAVNRLRGKPGTKVVIYVSRAGWSSPKRFVITREIIHVRSVESKYLGKNIGYVSLKRFQEDTADEVRTQINKLMNKHKIKGLVLDLRQNPGGLLDQAVESARLFINKGVIVITTEVGNEEGNVYRAFEDAPFGDLPIVVLVDGGSASAAEILTNALKRNNRALVVGTRTFGKGTVQVMREVGKGALKITIGQYLGPGRISIQGVGITPQIETVPVSVNKDDVTLLNPDEEVKNREHRLKAMGPTEKDKPWFVMDYLENANEEEQAKTNDEDERPLPKTEENNVKDDPVVQLAAQMVATGGSTNAKLFFKKVKGVLQSFAKAQDKLIEERFKQIGKDWRNGPYPENPDVVANIAVIPHKAVAAGHSLVFLIALHNRSDQPVYRVHGVTKSDNPVLDHKEFAVGYIPPKKTVRTKVKIKIPDSVQPSLNLVKFAFYAGHRALPTKKNVLVAFKALNLPRFAFSYQVQDRSGNQNGLAEPGETFDLVFDITNVGDGPSLKLLATLQNKSGHGVLVRTGRFTLKKGLGVGRTRQVRFRISLTKTFKEKRLKLALGLTDIKLRRWVAEEIEIPVYRPSSLKTKKFNGALEVVAKNARVLPGADASLPAIYAVQERAFLKGIGKIGGFYKIDLGDGRFGFIMDKQVRPVKGVVKYMEFPEHPFYAVIQPQVRVLNLRELLKPLGQYINVKGRAKFFVNPLGSRKVYAFVDKEKVYFNMLKPDQKVFEFNFPVTFKKAGMHTIRVIAHEGKTNLFVEEFLVVSE